nr:hypothetical protein CPHELBEB_04990 [Salmonella sp.]
MSCNTNGEKPSSSVSFSTLGYPGGVLLAHSSFRSVRPLEDGPLGLIEALRAALGPGGTLVMPSWSGLDDEPFDPATSPVTPDLGVVSDTFWRLPNVKRSAHPFAFAAAGPQAEQIISDPLPLPPHSPASPVARVHELDGQVLLSSAWDTMPTRRCILPS